MLPYITLFGRSLPLYGLCAVAGALLGLGLIVLRCPRFRLRREDAVYIYVLGIVGALIGAKLLYLLTVLPEFLADLPLLWQQTPVFMARYLSGGMVFYGGLLGGSAAAALCARSYRVRLRDFFPVLLPALAVLAGFGRIGCFCAGCCYGVPAQNGLGIVLRAFSPEAPGDVARVPVQLMEAVYDLLLAAVLCGLSHRAACRRWLAHIYLLAYCPMRFVLEFWRADTARGFFMGLSTSQWLSLLVLLGMGILWLWQRRRAENRGQASSP